MGYFVASQMEYELGHNSEFYGEIMLLKFG